MSSFLSELAYVSCQGRGRRVVNGQLFRWAVVVLLLLVTATATASTETPAKVLRAYGPGGPHRVLEECADLFKAKHGVDVVVSKALPHDLERKLREDGDLYFGGAEYMLEEFEQRNPGVLDMTSMVKLHPRRIGIIVRKGNPLDIKGIEDLQRKEIKLLDVKLENMRHFHGAQPNQRNNIRRYVYTGQQGVTEWLTSPEINAWVTYKSWHVWLEEEADFIEIAGDHALRFTPMALTSRTTHRQEARRFLSFLKSEEARQIFRKHGWD